MVGELELIDDELRGASSASSTRAAARSRSSSPRVLERRARQDAAADAAITRDSGDRAVDALRSLTLVRVDLRPDADGDGEPFAEFEFGLAPEDTDARLVAVDRHRREIVDVRFDA